MKKQAQTTYFFYQDGRITTVQEGQLHRAIFRAVNVPLAEQKTADAKDTSLLAIDGKNSIFTVQNAHGDEAHSFTAYGHNPTLSSAKTLLGYNGEQHASEDLYILGRGTRCYSTRMGRFLSPDAFSPFGRGGINAYAYCNGDPINYFDDSGNMRKAMPRPGGSQRAVQSRTTIVRGQDNLNQQIKLVDKVNDLVQQREKLKADRQILAKTLEKQDDFFKFVKESPNKLDQKGQREIILENNLTKQEAMNNKAELDSVRSKIAALEADRLELGTKFITLKNNASTEDATTLTRMFDAALKTISLRSTQAHRL
ncbi:MAG TPA: RHS repeat-associated core domain-containing protein [Pseudomonas sp.]|nr:RHS repeat-associated core domain-containing protein [Pseudomonas sp.]